MQIIQLLNTNSGAIQAFMAVLLAFITAYYAWQARRTVVTMREIEDERNRPRMLVYIEQREEWLNMVDLVITNAGEDVARNVQFSLDNELDLAQDGRLSEVPFVKNGFKVFSPKRIIKRHLVSLVGNLERLQNSDTQITVQYIDSTMKRSFVESFSLDFNGLIDHQIGEPPLYKIANGVEKLAKAAEKIERKMK